MPGRASRRRHRPIDIWPGFVDALTSLLLVITFLLVVFVLSQFFLRATVSGQNEALKRLTQQVSELADLLSLERDANTKLRANVAQLSTELQSTLTEREQLATQLNDLKAQSAATEDQLNQARAELESLHRDIEALRSVRAQLESQVAQLSGELKESQGKATDLAQQLGAERDRAKELEAKLADETERTQLAQKTIEEKDVLLRDKLTALESEQKLTAEQRAQIEVLNQQIAALRDQLGAIQKALDISEKTVKDQKVQISDLGKRLNLALAGKVQELARYRSEFFGKLREILGERADIRVVGDRFVFQSEVLFDTGSAELGPEGKAQLTTLARTLLDIAKEIPPDLDWILRVDGHTDKRPISTAAFPSNWDLSTQRALSVVRFLVSQGVPPQRLAAAGFGEFQPLDPGEDEVAYRRNRRIELKLTEH
jgi:chemotaxis protein MotB